MLSAIIHRFRLLSFNQIFVLQSSLTTSTSSVAAVEMAESHMHFLGILRLAIPKLIALISIIRKDLSSLLEMSVAFLFLQKSRLRNLLAMILREISQQRKFLQKFLVNMRYITLSSIQFLIRAHSQNGKSCLVRIAYA